MITMDFEKKEPIYNVLEKKWYIDFDKYVKKLRKRLKKESSKRKWDRL